MIFEEEYSCIDNKNGNQTGLVVQRNGWKQSSWTGLQTASCCATWTVSKCELRRIKQNGLTMQQLRVPSTEAAATGMSHTIKGRTNGGEVVERMGQVAWQDTTAARATQASWSLQGEGDGRKPIADADGVHADRSIQYGRLQRNSQKVKALPFACSTRFERIRADDASIKCLAEAEKDARQSISRATRTVHPSAAYSVGGASRSSSGPQSLRSPSVTARTAAEAATRADAHRHDDWQVDESVEGQERSAQRAAELGDQAQGSRARDGRRCTRWSPSTCEMLARPQG